MSIPNTIDIHTLHDEAVTFLAPPHVPFGFVLRAEPAPLLTAKDGRYIVRAAEEESESEGLLIYEDYRTVAFLTADEAAAYLMYFIKEGWNLLPNIDLALSHVHAQAVEHMRSLWWLEETRKTREWVNAHLNQQDEVQQ